MARLERIYKREDLTPAQRIQQRDTVFTNWRADYRSKVVPQLQTNAFRGYAEEPLNNATLIGRVTSTTWSRVAKRVPGGMAGGCSSG